MAKAPRINVVLTEELLAKLQDVSKKTDMAQSAIIRKALVYYLKHLDVDAYEPRNRHHD